MTIKQATQVAASALAGSTSVVPKYKVLPNGLVELRTWWGWMYINEDGTIHSKQYS